MPLTFNRRKFAWKQAIFPGIAIILLLVIYWQRVTYQPPAPPNNVSRPAAPAPEVKHETTAATPIKTGSVQTYRPAMKADLKLPDSVVNDVTQQVIAASQIKASDHPQTVTTVINTDTGETETYVKEDPLPWLAINTTRSLSVSLLAGNRGRVFRGDFKQEFFQSKAFHFTGILTGSSPIGWDGKSEVAAGLNIEWRF